MKQIAQKIFISSSTVICCILTSIIAQAQISSDGTLPTPTSVNQINNIFEITGGTQAGNNLFHSLKEFSVFNGSEAFFKQNPNTSNITNIITRITGGSISNIDGLIRENYGANLILINPSGINFGVNAQLNIGGSFLGTTASSLTFADGAEFSATNTQNSPLLTISVPVGLQFGQNPAVIRVQGTGHNFTVSNPIFSPVTRSNSSTGLRVQPGQTLALIGGNLSLDGGTLTAEGGRIELGSVAGGLVSLKPIVGGWTFSYQGVPTFRDIELSQKALADTSGSSGSSGGFIQVQGRNLGVRDGSLILIQNQGFQPNGSIQVNTSESVKVSGVSTDGNIRSSLTNETVGIGGGGDVTVSTRNLVVEGGASIVAKTFTPATGGNININAFDLLQVNGASIVNPSVTSSIVAATFGPGNSGNNTISTRSVSATGGGTITSASFGSGKGGNLNVNAADTVEIMGVEPNFFAPSALFVTAFNAGDSGNLTLNAPRLTVKDGGRVGTLTSASGASGNVTINAPEFVEVKGTVPGSVNPSLIGSAANLVDPTLQQLLGLPPVPSGASGNVTINTGQLRVTDGATVTARNDGSGNSGFVKVNADSIFLDSGGSITSELGGGIRLGQFFFFSPVSLLGDKGGDIAISTQNLVVRGGASISTATFTDRAGGNVNVNASDSVEVSGFIPFNPNAISFISASTFGLGKSGNINLSTGKLTIADGGTVGAATFGIGSGGDISINATNSVEVIGVEPSFLKPSILGVSTFNGGNAGNLTINTPKLFVRDGGRVDASTVAAGSAGSITINAPQSVEVTGTIVGTSIPSQISSGANIESEITRQLFRLPPAPSGASGGVTINTSRLVVKDGAQVTARNEGSGNAGDLKINAQSTFIDTRGGISAATTSGEGGNIFLRTNSLLMRGASQISTETGGTGNGGNITITGNSPADFVALLEGSKIIANAFQGNGGNISINTQGLFVCPECQISASSQFGLDGQVKILTFDTSRNPEVLDLSPEIAKPEEVVAQACPAKKNQSRSQFIISGRGGLPPRPSEPLSSNTLISFESTSTQAESSTDAIATAKTHVSQLPPPAQGWYVNPKGVLILTADSPTAIPYASHLTSASCHATN
ncbi:filamentous hemagglutinin N-terminal domain-containing protein [Nostoc linckia FACHB-104]|nr:filamentous hemagglutinin N-terminal domain-containing protein [Nostoc linckia FACHB-104]